MRHPVVDLRAFRLSKINDPQYSHLKYLLGWVGYFTFYFLTENLIPVEQCHVIHMPLDDMIPFCEYFLIPYMFWYLFIVITLFYFGLYDPDGFKKLMTFFIVTQVIAMMIYIAYPSVQLLRPTEFARDNVLTRLAAGLYAFDTNTGVCPSLHVAQAIGLASAWWKDKPTPQFWKIAIALTMFLVCLSVVFVKQHSALDLFAALPLALLAELIAYGESYWIPRWQQKTKSFA